MLNIFSYKGFIGLDASNAVDLSLNKVSQTKGQVALVIANENVQITEEAKQLFTDAPVIEQGVSILSFNTQDVVMYGNIAGLLPPEEVSTSSRDDREAMLNLPVTDLEIPEEFKEAVDHHLRKDALTAAGEVEIQQVN